MGQRASYALVEDGKLSLFSSHWGASTVDRDFFWGPEHALAFVKQQDPKEEWLDDLWCEGGALIDVDRRVLLFFGGEDIHRDPLRHRLTLALMRRIWSRWTVSWAKEGLGDVVDALGLPRDLVRSETRWEAHAPDIAKARVRTILSTDRGLYGLHSLPSEVLRSSPAAFAALPDGEKVMERPLRGGDEHSPAWGDAWIRAGLHLDFTSRRADLWQLRDMQDHFVPWDGWQLVHHEDRFEAQLALAPGLRFATVPRLVVLEELWNYLLARSTFDPLELLATVEETTTLVALDPHFTSYHPRELPRHERILLLGRALKDLPSLWAGDIDEGR